MAPLCGTSHNARCWLCTDCCGLMCAAFSYSVILFSQLTMSRQLYAAAQRGALGSWHAALHFVFFNGAAGLAIVSHTNAMLSDPGAVPKNAEPLPGDAGRLRDAVAAGASHRKRAKGWCHRCAAYKPPRAHHCNVTGRCIVKLDHYCPWTNNAIGVRNHKFFLLFIWYTFVLCFYALALLVALAVRSPAPVSSLEPLIFVAEEGRARARDDRSGDKGAAAAFGMSEFMVAMASVLFGLFTSCMLCDQWSVLSTNVAKIDRLKGEELDVSTEVNEVFGGRTRGFHLHWLLPLTVVFPESLHDDVMGYRLPEIAAKGSGRTGFGDEDDAHRASEDLEDGGGFEGDSVSPDATDIEATMPNNSHDDSGALVNRAR